SPMIPEPITVARRNAVPSASATARRGRSTAAITRLRAAAAGRRGRGFLGSAHGGATRARVGLHHRCVCLHDEHLPRVSIRILDPDLVLHCIAAGGVFLAERRQTHALETRLRLDDVLRARDLDAE